MIRVMKTYAWIKATADSRIVKIRGIGRAAMLIKVPMEANAFPRRDINRWPAMRFAVSRTHNVIGRIMLLTSSITTINIIRAAGVPWGTKWDSMWLVFFSQPKSIKESQNISEIGRVMVMWEVGEKIWGYKARKFITKIMQKIIRIKSSLPFSFFPNVNLTSFLKVVISFFFIFMKLDCIFHILIT